MLSGEIALRNNHYYYYYYFFAFNRINTPGRKCIEDNSTKTIFRFLLAVKIDLDEVIYYLKFKQVFYFLSKLYDKKVSPA